MNTPQEKPRTPAPSSTSPEAIIGIGVTIASLGVLFLLLGWAQAMRQVHDAAWILIAIGGVAFVVGLITAFFGRAQRS